MPRLNQKAYDILKEELDRIEGTDSLLKVQKEIALKRLTRLKSQEGNPYSFEELLDALDDLFPKFDRKVLRAAARANLQSQKSQKSQVKQSNGLWNKLKWGTIATVSIVGGLWIVNLPYPPIRWPVSRVAPILLMPSFMSMDHNYRQAIASVEQADQLVNQATSPADLDLGAEKVKKAQNHLDALPVWFIGYYPRMYCTLFSCGWRFTLDEFQQARKSVARMDARLFQENNVQKQLETAEQTILQAKQSYQIADNEAAKQSAIAQVSQCVARAVAIACLDSYLSRSSLLGLSPRILGWTERLQTLAQSRS